MKQYKIIPWMFNEGAWGRAMQEAVDNVGLEVVADVMDVDPNTVRTWIKGMKKKNDQYPFPRMTNFIRAINELDLDPREFFCLVE